MSVDEYWQGHPFLVKAYRDAYKMRMRHENEYAWLQGAYISNAVMVAIGNTFGGKGKKKPEYMKEPLDLGLETEMEKEEKVRREREKIVAMLNAWKSAWDRRQR